MHPLAHHAGEQALAPLLLLAGGGFTLVVAIGRAWAGRRQGTAGQEAGTAEQAEPCAHGSRTPTGSSTADGVKLH